MEEKQLGLFSDNQYDDGLTQPGLFGEDSLPRKRTRMIEKPLPFELPQLRHLEAVTIECDDSEIAGYFIKVKCRDKPTGFTSERVGKVLCDPRSRAENIPERINVEINECLTAARADLADMQCKRRD